MCYVLKQKRGRLNELGRLLDTIENQVLRVKAPQAI